MAKKKLQGKGHSAGIIKLTKQIGVIRPKDNLSASQGISIKT